MLPYVLVTVLLLRQSTQQQQIKEKEVYLGSQFEEVSFHSWLVSRQDGTEEKHGTGETVHGVAAGGPSPPFLHILSKPQVCWLMPPQPCTDFLSLINPSPMPRTMLNQPVI